MTISGHTDHRINLPSQSSIDSQQSNTADLINDPRRSFQVGTVGTHSLNSTRPVPRPEVYSSNFVGKIRGLFLILLDARPGVPYFIDPTSHTPWLFRNALLFVIYDERVESCDHTR